ncbi:MAG: Microbacterium phage Armstrong, partial [Gemmatimonadota bacterium]
MARQIDVVIDADARGFARGTQQAADSLDRFHKSALVAAAGAAAAFAAVNIGSFAKDSLLAASDLNETMSKTSVVFGDAAGWVQEWSKGTATALGQTRTQALDAAATFGVFGKSAGLTGDALGSFSTDMTVLASDMASFSNTSVDQAIEAIGAAMRGESEPIRAYGVLLDDATLKARAMKLGIYDGNGALTQQQRVLAAQAEILAQTSDAQGDFARTQGGMANQMRIFSAQWGTLKTTVGEAMLPLATSIMPQLNRAVEAGAAKLAEYMPQIKAGAESAAKFVGDLLAGFKANGPDGEQAMASLKIAAGELGDLAKSAAEKAAALTRWFTEMSPEAQKATLAIGGTVAALLLLNGTAKANPVTRIGVELTGTVMKATAEGAIGLLFRSLANRIAAMTVTAGVVYVNGGVAGGGLPGAPGGADGKPGGRFASTLKAVGALTVVGTAVALYGSTFKDQAEKGASSLPAAAPMSPGLGYTPGMAESLQKAKDQGLRGWWNDWMDQLSGKSRQATEETIRNTEAQREAAAATRAREAAMAPLAAITALQTNA